MSSTRRSFRILLNEHPSQVADLLDAVPGAYERALLGLEQGRAANTKRLEDL